MSDAIPRTDSLHVMQSLLGGAYDDDTFNEGHDDSGELQTIENNDQDHDVNNISGSDDEEDTQKRKPSPIIVPQDVSTADESPTPEKRPKFSRKPTKLVSYGPDDKDEGDKSSSESEDDGEDDGDQVQIMGDEPMSDSQLQSKLSRSMLNKSRDEIQLPPEPPGKCARQIEAKVMEMQDRAKKKHSNVNEAIQKRKDFRNPSIYEKLIDFCHIDEKGTNYPPEIYDPSIYGKESFYDALAKLQKEEMDKRERERKERTKVEFVIATKKQSSSELSKAGSQNKLSSSGVSSSNVKQERKSKWDTQGASNSNNKTTVISAVGTLKKQK